ncbi:hypothetical protein BHM03_00052573, partial [Ensete ventricosum]
GRFAVKQPAQASGKKPAEGHPAGTEDAKQSRSRRPFHARVAAGSQSDSEPSPNRSVASTVSRPRVRPAPRGEEPLPFHA